MSKWTTDNIGDQGGKLAIVTGANIGLGFETAKALAEKGTDVILACRNLEKAAAAEAEIRPVAKGKLEVRQLDVSDLNSVTEFAKGIQRDFTKLDLLINNAGVMACPQAESAQGHELQFATNHLGHFALTGHLLPLLEAAPEGRVIAVSSIAHRPGRFYWKDLNHKSGYKAFRVYCQSKLANLVFALELDRRLKAADSSVLAAVAHPGMAATNLAFAGPAFAQNPIGKAITKVGVLACNSPLVGALPTLLVATEGHIKGGEYYGPRSPGEFVGHPAAAKISLHARSESDAKQLWAASEQMTGCSYLS